MLKLIGTLLFLILIPAAISCADFIPDPVYEHIRIHGSGIDMTGIWTGGKSNRQLRNKNFKSKGR